ncbi:MAG: hypothetical protein ACPHDL_07260 [Limisphaerales bacterium]
MCFIEDNKIILEEHPALPGLIHRVEQGKEKGMVEGYRKDKDDFKGCFDGREEGDDGLDLPF